MGLNQCAQFYYYMAQGQLCNDLLVAEINDPLLQPHASVKSYLF